MALPGVRNEIDATVFDRQAVTNADSNKEFKMFQNRVGSAGKTRFQTNMKADGEFPKPERFTMKSLRAITVTSTAADGAIILDATTVEFNLNDKAMHEWLTMLLPGGAGVPGTSDINGISDIRAVYTLERPYTIEHGTPFAAILRCGDVSGLVAAVDVIVAMDGLLQKAVN